MNKGEFPMRHRRFTLRTMMAVILIWGALLAWVRSMGSFAYALVVITHSFLAWALCFITVFVVTRNFGPVVHGPRRRATVTVFLALALLASLYLAWGHHSTMHEMPDLGRRFPYPDPAIIALERWFDARMPVHPGTIKTHGELDLVGFLLGMLVIVAVSLAGFLLGVASNRRSVAGPELRGTPGL